MPSADAARLQSEAWFSGRLEWLLTPAGSHGLGVQFAKSLVERVARQRSDEANGYARRATFLKFGKEGLGVGVSRLSLRNANVSTELYLPASARRGGPHKQYCDVVLTDFDSADSFLLCVENKLFMPPTEEQLRGYEEAVDREYRRIKVREFVILTLYPRRQPMASAVASHWVRLSWAEDIQDLLNSLLPNNSTANEDVSSLRDLLAWHRLANDPQALPEDAREGLRAYLLEAVGQCLHEELTRLHVKGGGHWRKPDVRRRMVVLCHSTQPASRVEITSLLTGVVAVQAYRSDRPTFDRKITIPFGVPPTQVTNHVELLADRISRQHLHGSKRSSARRRPVTRTDGFSQYEPLFAFIHEHRRALRVLLRRHPMLPRVAASGTPEPDGKVERQRSLEFFEDGPTGPTDARFHAAILGADDQHTWDLNDPRQFEAAMARLEAASEARKAKQAARKARRPR